MKKKRKKKKDGKDKPNENLSDEKWLSRARVKPFLDEQETTENGKELNKAIVMGEKTSSGEKCGMQGKKETEDYGKNSVTEKRQRRGVKIPLFFFFFFIFLIWAGSREKGH